MRRPPLFQLLLKECTIEATLMFTVTRTWFEFQLLLKECTIEACLEAKQC